PINSHNNIHLDNLSALINIQLFLSLHKFSHIKNWDILFIIHYLIKTKSLNISFHKNKSYSNNSFHNQANLLAKQDTNKYEIISNFKTILPPYFTWHDHIIPIKTCSFLQNTITIQSLLTWSQLKYFQNPLSIKWSTNLNIINSLNNDQKFYSFRLKIINNNLPTMQNLNIRYPLLYTTPNCVHCQLIEDIPH